MAGKHLKVVATERAVPKLELREYEIIMRSGKEWVVDGYGGVALYQDEGKDIRCKLDKSIKSVDQWGDAFKATGFSCRKDLFIVVKEYLDINRVLFIVLDPNKFDQRHTYEVDLFLEYKEDEKK